MPALLPLLLSAAALAWPGDEAWEPLMMRVGSCDKDPAYAWDAVGDDAAEQPHLDIVGEECGETRAASWAYDSDTVYLRMRLAESPLDGGQLRDGAWGALLDLGSYSGRDDAALILDGSADALQLWFNSDPTTGWDDTSELLLWQLHDPLAEGALRVVDAGSSVGGGSDVFLDLSLSNDLLMNQLGLLHDSTIGLFVATGLGGEARLDNDLMGCDGSAEDCSPLVHRVEPVAITDDIDNDGLSNAQEAKLGTMEFDADSDDDGLLDGEEVAAGTNPLLCDSDEDGLIDGMEAGVATQHADTQEPGGGGAPPPPRPPPPPPASPYPPTFPAVADCVGEGLLDG